MVPQIWDVVQIQNAATGLVLHAEHFVNSKNEGWDEVTLSQDSAVSSLDVNNIKPGSDPTTAVKSPSWWIMRGMAHVEENEVDGEKSIVRTWRYTFQNTATQLFLTVDNSDDGAHLRGHLPLPAFDEMFAEQGWHIESLAAPQKPKDENKATSDGEDGDAVR